MSKNNIAPWDNANTLLGENTVTRAIWNTLKNSIHPNASDDAIISVLISQKELGVPALTKCYHIYKYGEVEQIIPAVVQFDIQAHRSGVYAGFDDPTYGPMITKKFTNKYGKDITVSYPEWCKIVIYRIVQGQKCAFPHIVWWEEEYGKEAKYKDCPNNMWATRSRGMLWKVARSQGLRIAFPECCKGHTYEEMAGKAFFDDNDPTDSEPKIVNPVQNNNEYLIDGKQEIATDLVKIIINIFNEVILAASSEEIYPAIEKYEAFKNKYNEEIRGALLFIKRAQKPLYDEYIEAYNNYTQLKDDYLKSHYVKAHNEFYNIETGEINETIE